MSCTLAFFITGPPLSINDGVVAVVVLRLAIVSVYLTLRMSRFYTKPLSCAISSIDGSTLRNNLRYPSLICIS